MDDATLDEILRGRLRLWQPRAGYRFNVDALLLAHFVASPSPRGPARIIDLCAGVGVIGLALALRWPSARVTLAELQPRMVALARSNIEENGFAERVTVAEVDLGDASAARSALAGAAYDLAVSCPPYFELRSGPTVLDEGEAIARHEVRMDLADLAREARRLLVPGGRVALVFPSKRLVALFVALDEAALRPTRLRAVHQRPDTAANRVLVEAVKGGKAELTIEPPLILRDAANRYGREAHEILGEVE